MSFSHHRHLCFLLVLLQSTKVETNPLDIKSSPFARKGNAAIHHNMTLAKTATATMASPATTKSGMRCRMMTMVSTTTWMVLLSLASISTTATQAFVPATATSKNSISTTAINREWHRISSPSAWITMTPSTTTTSLWGAADHYHHSSEGSGDFAARNKARLDVRNFLTQRSIQSFVYLLNQCREEHTVQFLENTLDFTNIDKYHGTGAFNQTLFPNWDSIFLDYVDRPEETIVVTVKQRQRRRSSLSGRNSYLDSMSSGGTGPSTSSSMKKTPTPSAKKPNNNNPSHPRGVAESYLESLNNNNDNNNAATPKPSKSGKDQSNTAPRLTPPKGIAGNYLESLASNTGADEYDDKSSIRRNRFASQSDEVSPNPYVEEKSIQYELEVDPSSVVRRILAVREQLSQEWIQDLDMLMQLNDEIVEAYEEYKEQQQEAAMEEDDEDDDEDHSLETDDLDTLVKKLVAENIKEAAAKEAEKVPVFDSNVWYTWTQSLCNQDRDSSPFRKKNFDLLLLLSTQESIHRVLKAYKSDDDVRPESYEWLLDFYKERVTDHFDGHQPFGSAEKFLEKMVRSPPTMIESDTKVLGVLAWVDPAQIAEDIVRERSEVALAWMQVAKLAQDEHTDLRRLLFSNSYTKSEEQLGPAMSDIIINPSLLTHPGSIASNSTVGAFE